MLPAAAASSHNTGALSFHQPEMHHVEGLKMSPRSMARAVLTSSALYPWVRRRALRQRPITVLMYHTLGEDGEDFDAWTVVPMAEFQRQMDHLRSHYDVVSLDDALAHHTSGRFEADGRPLAVVTFDDGHSGLHRHLLPYVEKERLPVTVFVATGHVETGRSYWFDRAMNALQSTDPWMVDLSAYGLTPCQVGRARGPSNWESIRTLLDGMKRLSPNEREQACDELVRQAQGAKGSRFVPLAPLTLPQLCELGRSPWITIGAHTHGHELLDQLGPAEARQTMAHSRDLLQSWTGLQIRHFAYPNGNYNAAVSTEARRLGFASAFTTRKGLWTTSEDLHELPRIPVGRYDDLPRFKWALLGGRVFH